MEKLISKLQAQARAHPTNPILRRILPQILYLLNGIRPDSPDVKHKYEELHRDLGMLATEGHWGPSKEDEDSLRQLKRKLGLLQDETTHDTPHADTPIDDTHPQPIPRPSSDDLNKHVRQGSQPIVQPPPLSTPLLPVSTTTPIVLPIELVQTMNQTFFLHLLATEPQRVLPPGKSLVSMMAAPRTNAHPQDDTQAKLEERVKDMVHREFWKEALESLSSPSPDKHLPRLRRLYEDLLSALNPLLPKNDPVLVTLSLPLSPTSAPLRSAVMHLRESLVTLRTRASPARDERIDSLLQALDEPNQLATTEELARIVADTARSILELTELMKEDLSQFMLGSMEEKDLKAMITQQAMLGEKSLILQLWPPSRVEPAWKGWVDGSDVSASLRSETAQTPHHRWMYRLVQALGTNSAVACPLPTLRVPGTEASNPPQEEPDLVETPPNTLPPPFFVTTTALLAAQNYLQALVIAASLRSLVRLPPRSTAPHHQPAPSEDGLPGFMGRIWTLLRSSADSEPGAEDTKVVNLADEVVRVRRACIDDAHPCGPDEEARLRAAVDRTLQPRDPVFLLLQKRLLQALAAWLVSATSLSDGALADGRASTPGPMHMQTGRERPGKRPRLHLGLDEAKSVFVCWERERGRPPAIKGFEDEVLVRAVGETFAKVGALVDWTGRIWQDLVETGEVGGSTAADDDGRSRPRAEVGTEQDTEA